MERKNFTEEEINKLKENKFVKSITTKSISYTDEFKKLFIEESNKGKGPTRIFIESGFNPYVLGSRRIKEFSRLYKKKNKNNELLVDNRGKSSTGRPKKPKEKSMSKDEEIEFLKHQNLMLKAENDLLKKMEFLVKQQELKKLAQKTDIN